KKAGEDGRKSNGGTPPRRRPGTSYSPVARSQMSAAAKQHGDDDSTTDSTSETSTDSSTETASA
ncbi:hypothetical protein, partial [Streptomyces sp. TR06-5]|uniref:hypothetical protein n=1 Tax=Streptomyces sp. TR06-5 TaxID=3385976 RepID=UPI0039A14ADF